MTFLSAPGHFRDSWRITEGFVVAEAKSILPARHVSRPDLVDCHLAIILSSFLQAGLLEVSSISRQESQNDFDKLNYTFIFTPFYLRAN